MIPYGRHSIGDEEIAAIAEVLRSDFLTQGPLIEKFEEAFAHEVKAPYAVACSSGTAALHLAALATGIKPGDRVLVPAITFVASANAARFVGAEVSFADIDSGDLTISPSSAEEILEKARRENRPFRAIITVDLAGHPCDMEAFSRLADTYNLIWISDSCHSLGAKWTQSPPSEKRWSVGEWPRPDCTVFSFHPVKHITTGEGGMVVTHNAKLASKLRSLRSHGVTRSPKDFVFVQEAFDLDGQPNPWYYEVQALGFNYRLTDLQCALGLCQLKRLPGFLARRQAIASRYRTELEGHDFIRFPTVRPGCEHSWHLAIIRVDFAALGKSRAQVMRELRERGIGTQVHYIPVPMMPLYAGSTSMKDLPLSLGYYREALSLPIYPGLDDDTLAKIIQEIKTVLR